MRVLRVIYVWAIYIMSVTDKKRGYWKHRKLLSVQMITLLKLPNVIKATNIISISINQLKYIRRRTLTAFGYITYTLSENENYVNYAPAN